VDALKIVKRLGSMAMVVGALVLAVASPGQARGAVAHGAVGAHPAPGRGAVVHRGFPVHRGVVRGSHGHVVVGVSPFLGYFPPAYVYPAPTYWYYCPSYGTYYPYPDSCPVPWVPVPAS